MQTQKKPQYTHNEAIPQKSNPTPTVVPTIINGKPINKQ